MLTVILDARHTAQVATILELFAGWLDAFTDDARRTLPLYGPYTVDDLRVDVDRLHRQVLVAVPVLHTPPIPAANGHNELPDLLSFNRHDIDEIAYILGRLEDFLLHGDEQATLGVAGFLTNSSPPWLARWIGELASHLRHQAHPDT
jgi:hypothetical protein